MGSLMRRKGARAIRSSGFWWIRAAFIGGWENSFYLRIKTTNFILSHHPPGFNPKEQPQAGRVLSLSENEACGLKRSGAGRVRDGEAFF
jgi:hypothetical protein